MRRALELAALADHATSPNPMVGAVLVDGEGRLLASGHHERAGLAHAEAGALARAGELARGATLYVTLEPCAFHGRTPPCVDAIVASGVRRVVVAMLDPDPRVNGLGMERLLEAGIEVSVGTGELEARRLNQFYVTHRTTGRPFVSAKFAVSLDGKVATRTGDSRWITSAESRAHSHRLRHLHDAILVGVGTVEADNPQLTARFEGARQPLRVVLDSTLRTPPDAAVVGPNTLVITTERSSASGRERLQAAGAEVSVLAGDRPDPGAVLDLLGSRSILSVLIEGGGGVHGSFFDSRLVDRVYAYVAPIVIGGEAARGAIAGRGPARLSEALRLEEVETLALGPDLLVMGSTRRAPSSGQALS